MLFGALWLSRVMLPFDGLRADGISSRVVMPFRSLKASGRRWPVVMSVDGRTNFKETVVPA